MVVTTIRVVKVKHISVNMLDQFAEKKINKLSVFLSNHHCRKSGGLNVGNADSAVDRRVVFALVLFQVEVNNLCTVGNILTNVIESVRLNTGGERSHLSLLTLVPDDTLNETLAAAHGKEVNGGGGGLELHWVSCVDELSIGQNGALRTTPVPLAQAAHA